MKVLIADDSAIVRKSLTKLISSIEGISGIYEAQDAAQTIELVKGLKPDALILDIRMPQGNGIEVLQEVKKNNPALVVIMLTNYPYPHYRKKCKDLGADFFLDKSNEFEKIPVILKQLIQDTSA
ncbi:response regulator transcription factor [candidate division KSB1 bacterium]|nr:response regulator transcription factor [candidate division KSB1 bacterium]